MTTPLKPAPPRAIVAVGASAGGLEAFSHLLACLPPERRDLAFVFIQHLSPQHASALPELLAAKTSLTVVTAASGMSIDAGKLYVIPPNVQMEVVDGDLQLRPRPSDRSQFTPIDFFMQSLARWGQERVIGVILSGTASDGAAGIREVKSLGGITIAQAPETAKHEGMPQAAIATGQIDLVLSPEDIAAHLSHAPGHPYLSSRDEALWQNLTMSDGQLRNLFGVLRRASGIDFKQYKTPTVKRRLLRRMALARVTDIDAYFRYLADTPAEAKALSQDLLIQVTRFFRDPESFGVISRELVSELVKDRGDDPIRMWVPGCSTGEEAYSLGICLLEALGDHVTDRRIQIFATDVSEAAVEQARAGAYPASIAADVSPERLKRFFTRADGGYRIIKTVRDICVFARHDLTRDPPFSRLDAILCRNVLIYLDLSLQRRLMATFHYALKTRGYLMLGPAETPGAQVFFTVVDKKWRLFRKASADIGLPESSAPDAPVVAHPPPSTRTGVMLDTSTVRDEATRIILDRYGPPGVVVDATLQIVQFRGHTGPYLEAASGEPNLNVLKMARGGLLHPLRSALQQAKRRSRVVRKSGLLAQRAGKWLEVALEVVPLTTSRGEHYLVLFHTRPAGAVPRRPAGRVAIRAARQAEGRVSELRRELAANREYLQSIIQELEAANEELQSANEEILSSNEELQSTNEELDTAKEELQSTNEELNTLNEELHSRNEELTTLNSDLTNLLSSVEIPIVIVGGDLGIRRFTPRAEQLFNLMSRDVGRPIGQINPNITADDLEGMIRDTIDAIAPREREVQDKSGKWLSLRIRPYKGVDNRLDGAVISLIDIDAGKRYQAFVERARDHFRAIVDVMRQPLLVLDGRARVRSANRRFYEATGLSADAVEGRDVATVGDGRWDTGLLHGLVEDALQRGESVERVIDYHPPRGARRSWRVSADPVPLEDTQTGVLLAIRDITDGGGET